MSRFVLLEPVFVCGGRPSSSLQNETGYPPSFMSFSIPRMKLIYAMYCWLNDRGKVRADMALKLTGFDS